MAGIADMRFQATADTTELARKLAELQEALAVIQRQIEELPDIEVPVSVAPVN